MKKGARVKQWQTIAHYEDIEITVPVSGRIEMIGKDRPGLFEWPEYEKDYPHQLLFDKDNAADESTIYSFAVRPLHLTPDDHYVKPMIELCFTIQSYELLIGTMNGLAKKRWGYFQLGHLPSAN